MKKYLSMLAVAALLVGSVGCLSDDAEKDAEKLSFDNASRYTVQVIPLTIEWLGFFLAPGESRTLYDIRDPDFRYEPADRVQEGEASTDRYIIFVDSPPDAN